ncbi:MAG: tetratricopeptide repeat protein [Candidatus Latescibacteria bacterium]|nr:tetratricopeptide repeat protein [Candidatus Latescibacterota bacterium]
MPRKTLKNKGKGIGHNRPARKSISVSLVFPILCVLFSCIMGCSKSEAPPSVEDLTEEAKAALEAGDYEAAVERFEELCGHSPEAALGSVGLGLCYAKMDCLDRAAIYLEQAVEMNAHTVDGYGALSVVYSALNRDAEAIQAAKEALALLASGYPLQFAPLITEWHIRTALMHSYFRVGAYPEAQAEAERISGLDFEDTIRLSDKGDRWILEGTSYSTYEGALLAFIEDVDSEE